MPDLVAFIDIADRVVDLISESHRERVGFGLEFINITDVARARQKINPVPCHVAQPPSLPRGRSSTAWSNAAEIRDTLDPSSFVPPASLSFTRLDRCFSCVCLSWLPNKSPVRGDNAQMTWEVATKLHYFFVET